MAFTVMSNPVTFPPFEDQPKSFVTQLIFLFNSLFLMDWKHIDEELIGRGELLLSLAFLEEYEFELCVMNGGKVRRPFKLTDGYVEFLAVVRYLFIFYAL
jgi:hypothetical protein